MYVCMYVCLEKTGNKYDSKKIYRDEKIQGLQRMNFIF